MTVAIIDYGSGNLRSAAKAFERATAEAGVVGSVRVTSDPADLASASHIVLPGVGAFADCRRGVEALPRMREALENAVNNVGKPFLGICVGMQLMAKVGREYGDHEGFGWLDAEVVALTPDDAARKIPHMGWNELSVSGAHPVLNGIASGSHAYFVHSYHMVCANPTQLLASVEYGGTIAAVVGRDNIVGTQFHPEKSQATGLRLIRNFLAWRP